MSSDKGRLDGRVAVVTGAGRGIGAGIAQLLASQGASVVVNDLGAEVDGSGRDSATATAVVDEIIADGGTAVADGADIADVASAEALVGTAVDKFGRLDVLVNAAGILRDRMIFNLEEDEWDDVIRVHLKGHYAATRAAARYWREQRNPDGDYRLINFTSVSGLYGAPGQPNYAAAKMGVIGFTYSCANALARYGVTANAISPGASTRMTDSIPDERRRGAGPAADERAPENIAPVVAWLAGTTSGWMNGQIVGARGYEVHLFDQALPSRHIVSDGPWRPERLAEQIERNFRPAVAGPAR